MKSVTISPKQKFLIAVIMVVPLFCFIYFNAAAVINYVATKVPPLIKILIFAGCLLVGALLKSIGKIREAGFSGQLSEKKSLFWKPLEIEISFRGGAVILLFLLQLFIFSLSLYIAVQYASLEFSGRFL